MTRASDEMERLLGAAAAKNSRDLGWSNLEAHRWQHEPFRGRVEPMSEHVLMTYFDTPRLIDCRDGASRTRSITANSNITLIPKGHTAEWNIHGALDVVHLYINEERLKRVAASLELPRGELVPLNAAPSPQLAMLTRMLAEELEGRPKNSLYADTLSELICMQLLRSHSSASGSARVERAMNTGFGLPQWQVRRIQDYLRAHMEKQVSLRELAGLVGLSPKHMCTAFRRAIGEPPHAWIRRVRMEEAKVRLLNPNADIAAISLDLGYRDQSAFSTAFRKVTGIAPGRWRRVHS